MGNVKLLVTCPLCKDPHLAIKAKKPTWLTPSTRTVMCDECLSTTTFRLDLPRNRENCNQINVTPLTFNISNKMLAVLKTEIEKKKAESVQSNEEKPKEEVVTTSDENSQDGTVRPEDSHIG
jgi:hypothetical protein